MSLTTFVARPEIITLIKVLRPPPPRSLGVPILVHPRSQRFGLIGTAFDYLLRFELNRRAPHAVARPWAADASLEGLFRRTKQANGIWRSAFPDEMLGSMVPIVAHDSIDELGDCVWLGHGESPDPETGRVRSRIGVPIKPARGEVFHDSLRVAFCLQSWPLPSRPKL